MSTGKIARAIGLAVACACTSFGCSNEQKANPEPDLYQGAGPPQMGTQRAQRPFVLPERLKKSVSPDVVGHSS